MSVSAMVETYDMPMTDYNEDGDIPMAGSYENWLQPLPHQMDEDAHHIGPFSDSQEVDMIAFEETTAEYEMADEAVQPQNADIDASVLDAEVYDATIHASPLPTDRPEIVGNRDENSELLEADGTIISQLQSEGEPHVALPHSDGSAGQHFPAPDTIPTHDALHLSGDDHDSVSALASRAADNEFDHHTERKEQEQNEKQTAAAVPSSEVANTVDTYSSAYSEHGTDSLRNDKAEDGEAEAVTPDPSAADGPIQSIEDAREVVGEHAINGEVLQALKVVEESAESVAVSTEESSAEHSELPTTSQVYLQPPPPIHLSLQVTSAEGDQPEFVLFSLPESSSHVTEEPLVLLQHNPSLFYEPVSAVFDAFRQEEYFSHIDELSEAEMALNAHELQLVISEDNIYSREVSLQDLYAMHQGVGLAGHLRLTLQSNVPRFITRYNHLRDQITRLVLGDETDEARQHAEYTDTGGEVHETPGREAQPLVSLDESREESNHDDASAEPEADQENEDGELHDIVREIEESNENVSHGATGGLLEGDEQDQDEFSEHDDDASGESDDATYELDADATHVEVEGGAEPSAIEYAEYAHEAESDEEGNENHTNDFGEDGAEDTGAIGDTAELTVVPDDEETEPFATDERREEAQISQSTSTSSLGADESSWEDVGEEDGRSQSLEEETNQSIQQTAATVFDEEGNLADEVEAVDEDDLGDDDFVEGVFDDSTASTLGDPTEEDGELIQDSTAAGEGEKDTDASSRALLAESENFVSKLENDNTAADVTKGIMSDDDVRKETLSPSTVTSAASEARVTDKNAAKRSLDVANLDADELNSLSSPPDSKRTRVV